MISGGIFGPKLSGKTTLAKHLSREYWAIENRRSLVFDIHRERDWGPQAWVSGDKQEFWPAIWRIKDCLVIVDEAAVTINREQDLVPVFTVMRHNRHKLLIIGHSGRDLLPSMRQNFDVLFLFRQPPKIAQIWSETFANDELMLCTKLDRYEFIQANLFGTTQRKRLQVG